MSITKKFPARLKFHKLGLVKWLSRPFKTRWILLTHPDPIHDGIWWRLYRIGWCGYTLKAQHGYRVVVVESKYLPGSQDSDKIVTVIYPNDGARYISVMGIGDWEMGKDCRCMSKREMTYQEVQEFLFTEAI